jgi:hypothetical protein
MMGLRGMNIAAAAVEEKFQKKKTMFYWARRGSKNWF